MKPAHALLPATVALLSSPILANDHIEEIVVSDSRQAHRELLADIARQATADSAQLLRSLPGANVNSIGTLSGIAQYRGLSGERVAVQLDGAPVFSGGPNAMDAPLSYAPSLLLKRLTVTRGIAPVTASQES
ncbi:MAG: TonB-dependent receptor plug domain-containing protein, partial [Porticoccaceae bacterium]|nr:TonB-dependent receptor plug domain-containing protein [Porticoccaceae bacterium]